MESDSEKKAPNSPAKSAGEIPDFTRPLRPIAELVSDPDFPESAMGEHVDIGGYAGVVVELVRQSLKVRSVEGTTKSFNVNGLRRIYAPRPEPVPVPPIPEPPPRAPERTRVRAEPPPPMPPPPMVEPDFGKPIQDIKTFTARPDFPQCMLGEHVQIGDYTGVVVQIANRSLKVRSTAETTRSYNADALRKLYPK